MPSNQTYNYLFDWIENLQFNGRITFSFEEAANKFSFRSKTAIAQSLARASQRGRIVPIYRGFYLIIPVEYSHKKMLPPIQFVNDLMEHLSKPYYVGLQSAAAIHGNAGKPRKTAVPGIIPTDGLGALNGGEELFVVTNTKQLTTRKKDVSIHYIIKHNIPAELLTNKKTETGQVKVSSPELTAFDLVYYCNRVGGIKRASELISEFSDALFSQRIVEPLLRAFPVTTVQRMGYISEYILKRNDLARTLHKLCIVLALNIYRQPLSPQHGTAGGYTDRKWQVIVNI